MYMHFHIIDVEYEHHVFFKLSWPWESPLSIVVQLSIKQYCIRRLNFKPIPEYYMSSIIIQKHLLLNFSHDNNYSGTSKPACCPVLIQCRRRRAGWTRILIACHHIFFYRSYSLERPRIRHLSSSLSYVFDPCMCMALSDPSILDMHRGE